MNKKILGLAILFCVPYLASAATIFDYTARISENIYNFYGFANCTINDFAPGFEPAQSFQVGSAMNIASTSFKFAGNQPQSDYSYVTIEFDSNNEPSGIVLGTSNLIDNSLYQSGNIQLQTLTFTPTISIGANTRYWIVLHRTVPPNCSPGAVSMFLATNSSGAHIGEYAKISNQNPIRTWNTVPGNYSFTLSSGAATTLPYVNNLGQYISDGATPLKQLVKTTDGTPVIKGTLHADAGRTVRLEAELRPLGESFTDTGGGRIVTSAYVAPGETASVSYPGLTDGYYHWRARAVDNLGNTSEWLDASPGNNMYFQIKLLPYFPSNTVILESKYYDKHASTNAIYSGQTFYLPNDVVIDKILLYGQPTSGYYVVNNIELTDTTSASTYPDFSTIIDTSLNVAINSNYIDFITFEFASTTLKAGWHALRVGSLNNSSLYYGGTNSVDGECFYYIYPYGGTPYPITCDNGSEDLYFKIIGDTLTTSTPPTQPITVITENITANTTWTASSTYILDGEITVTSGAILTITEGTIVKFKSATSSLIVSGILNASSARSSSKIYFTSFNDDTVGGDTNEDGVFTKPSAGDWNGLKVNNGGSANVSFVVVRYGGYDGNDGSSKMLWNNGGILDLKNSEIASSSDFGIYHSSGVTNILASDIHSNNVGFYVNKDDNRATINSSNIHNNFSYGVYYFPLTGGVSAENNFWGDGVNGPRKLFIQDVGTGDQVSYGVNYIPWLEKPHFLNVATDGRYVSAVHGKMIRYVATSTKYMSSLSSAIEIWNTEGHVLISTSTSVAVTDLIISDVSSESASFVASYTPNYFNNSSQNDVLLFNDYYMASSTPQERVMTSLHELGHALALFHSYAGNIMNSFITNQSVLGSQDVSDYNFCWVGTNCQ